MKGEKKKIFIRSLSQRNPGRTIFAQTFLLIFVAVVSGINNYGCKDPHEYKPHFDSLCPPPNPPQLISPRNDTSFWYETNFPHNIVLRWNSVEDAENYELQIVRGDTTLFQHTEVIQVEETDLVYTITGNGIYYWHVRAYSRKWTWYTNWSETWHFGAYYAP